MAHVAIQEADDQGQVVTWLEHVTDEEYTAAPAATDGLRRQMVVANSRPR